MLNEENKKLCWEVLSKYGIQSQMIMVVEECSELQKAVCKIFRERETGIATYACINDFREELIDTIVMCQQMLMAYEIDMAEVNTRAKSKLERALKK